MNSTSTPFIVKLMVWLLVLGLSGCGGAREAPAVALPGETGEPEESIGVQVAADAAVDQVFVLQESRRRPLPAPTSTELSVGDGVDVQGQGKAKLTFPPDLLTVTVMRDGRLTLSQAAIDEQAAEITILQNLGTFVNDFNPAAEIDKRLRVETDFAVIAATGTRFLVVREANTPLEWVIGLDATADDLMMWSKEDPNPSQPVVKSVPSGTARWIAPVGEPSPGIDYRADAVNEWMARVDAGEDVAEIGDVLWPFMETKITMASMSDLPAMDRAYDWGGVQTTLVGESALGISQYAMQDCNRDGISDLVVVRGAVRLDFRGMLGRVRGLDVTLMALEGGADGSLSLLNPRPETVERLSFRIEAGEMGLPSLWSEAAVHYAELTMTNGCLLGISLQAPLADGSKPPPQSALEDAPSKPAGEPIPTPPPLPADAVAEGSAAQLVASFTPTALAVDGEADDWLGLTEAGGRPASVFTAIVWDAACQKSYPAGYGQTDLRARVAFAYDGQNLYAAFWVEDDGFVGFDQSGYNYFQSDAPQILLDLDRLGDGSVEVVNEDDIQIDLLVGIREVGDGAKAARWALGPGTPRAEPLPVPIAATATADGYFLEAAIPWKILGISPEAGAVLGMAASVSDNDTPGTTRQECMISTAPARIWNDPTTWGTLTLEATR